MTKVGPRILLFELPESLDEDLSFPSDRRALRASP
eukprot:CAMPEP_0115556550 /NCGR_PEP_ID=MMETSP0271-20121206/98430_1 /TAXON_ID=71861 /ORGANISM="Scrippsiella trochoidea, Strain CCMP3099" /LENGTH=34 /DNA_ID= /DNA_START= /DNA_END= /DNA_ORIENTATION=